MAKKTPARRKANKNLSLPVFEGDIVAVPEDPGQSDLVAALNKAASMVGIGFMDMVAYKAFHSDKIAMKLLDKLVPKLSSQEINQKSEMSLSVQDIISSKKTEIPEEVKDSKEAEVVDISAEVIDPELEELTKVV